MNNLHLYNSLTRKKEAFTPIDPDHVRLYACGPTVYSYAHIGNARMAVVFDTLRNVLGQMYPKVTYVSNITDVDDKIMKASEDTGEDISDITKKYTRIYNEDMSALGVKAPDIQPHATDHIPEMIKLMEDLIEKDHAYEADGHVLFHVPSFPNYGGLSGRSRDEQVAGARVEVATYKKDPADFVLWKPSTKDQVGWDSPWGYGRPGWHIECSAMAEKHLGLPFDIHGGGADLKFPHHENEIAQSCCAHGKTDDLSEFSKYWVHNGFVTVEGEKMSKSLGNVTLAHELLEQGVEGMAIRLALLSSHYRQPLDWTKDKIDQANKLLSKLYKVLDGEVVAPLPYEPILDALKDDLNTPKAFVELNGLLKSDESEKKQYIAWALRVLGLPEKMETKGSDTAGIDEGKINELIEARKTAKSNKDFAKSDKIRDQLLEMGIEIKDTREGTIWQKVS
ncbi:MAG: cysteine--tRNA ligase [Bdellovibrionales bacterium]